MIDLPRGRPMQSAAPEKQVDREQVCLECWRDFTQDFLHLDCTGEHVVARTVADELRAWLEGRYEFIVRSGQMLAVEQSHPGAEESSTRLVAQPA